MGHTGKKIKELREQKGLTQKELANLLGCAQATIAEWETRKDRLPGGKLLKDVARALGVSVDYLLNFEKTKNSQVPCFGNIKSEKFTWPNINTSSDYVEVPLNEYGDNRFKFKILDDYLEPIAYKEDYCIFEQKTPKDGDIVLVRFHEKKNNSMIRIWQQQSRLVALSGINLRKFHSPCIFEIKKIKQHERSYLIQQEYQEKNMIVEGCLVAVKKILKSLQAYPNINYILS